MMPSVTQSGISILSSTDCSALSWSMPPAMLTVASAAMLLIAAVRPPSALTAPRLARVETRVLSASTVLMMRGSISRNPPDTLDTTVPMPRKLAAALLVAGAKSLNASTRLMAPSTACVAFGRYSVPSVMVSVSQAPCRASNWPVSVSALAAAISCAVAAPAILASISSQPAAPSSTRVFSAFIP